MEENRKVYGWLVRGRNAAVGCSFMWADARGGENYCGNQVWLCCSPDLSERKTKEEIVQSDGRKVEVDGSKGQFVSEYFRTSCPPYYKRDYFDKMF